ncbi:MAG: hypothetical protein KAU28_04775, partial [Phycisphaerae bacterium]|nr:hypothetical protein [Phycisphaerae bacterium]
DGITYALGGARWDRRKNAITELRFFCGSYFDMLDTCDCMENELLDCAAQYENQLPPETSGQELLSRLPLRRRWHKLYEKARPDAEKSPYEILLSGEGRSAAAAITTMVVFEDDRGRKRFFLGKRSGKGVAIQPGLNDLMPGGMFQPDANARPLQAVLPADWQENPLAEIDPAKFEEAAKKDFSIVRNVVREFAEELFDLSPAARGPAAGACDFDWYERAEVGQARPAKALLEMLKDPRGGAELAVTGVAWNLLNTRPDICTILCIKDGSWFETFKDMITVNREWSPTAGKTAGAAAWHVALGELGSSGYDEDAVLEALGELIGPENIAPVGAAAFWLGLRWLRDNRYL